MENNDSDIKQQFNGFCNTPVLWNNSLNTLVQLHLKANSQYNINLLNIIEKRLGKRVERFVSLCLNQQPHINVIAENIQIIKDKTTLGELDCILEENGKIVHLEIIYKFYLYDLSTGKAELEHWIGPNKRDSLVNKLNKLKDKQLPLLYHPETIEQLEVLGIDVKNVNQKVHFKGQLFIPIHTEITFNKLNNECLAGYYIHFEDVVDNKQHQFYFPSKLDWLIEPNNHIEWMEFDDIKDDLKQSIENQISPLCWMKDSNGRIIKLFIVWW